MRQANRREAFQVSRRFLQGGLRDLKIIFNSRNKKGRGCRIRNSNSGTVSDYLYDGNNLRVVKDKDGVITHYHYDLQGRLLAETDSDGTLRRAVVWYGATLAALIDIEQSEPTF